MKPEKNKKDNFRRPEPREETEENENQLEGRNALTEALRSGRTIDKVFIAAGDTDRSLQHLAAEAKKAGAVVVPVDRRKLDAMSVTRAHQGIIALAAAREYYTMDDILQTIHGFCSLSIIDVSQVGMLVLIYLASISTLCSGV